MLSGFWEEEEEPIARVEKKTALLDCFKEGEANTKDLDLIQKSNLLEEIHVVAVGIRLKLREIAIADPCTITMPKYWKKMNEGKNKLCPTWLCLGHVHKT